MGFIICLLANLMGGFLQAQTRPDSVVEFFLLNNVRLLDSPFKKRVEMDEQYMMKLGPDWLLAPFKKSAGLDPQAEQYGGWESTQLASVFGRQCLSGLALMYAATDDQKIKQRLDYMIDELQNVKKRWEPVTSVVFPKAVNYRINWAAASSIPNFSPSTACGRLGIPCI